jgi:formylglycine-generating enzyme required for sulfatase activity
MTRIIGLGAGMATALLVTSFLLESCKKKVDGGPASRDSATDSSTEAGRPAPPAEAGRTAKGKTIDLGNGVCMEFVLIPAGTFNMGSPEGEKDRAEDEGPTHQVVMSKPFYLGKYEVTQDQYLAVMGTNPSHFRGRNLPVETISWDDATAFCRKVGGRLPTEAEWEYACRAGSETRLSYGDDLKYTQLGNYAWYGSNSNKTTHAVGQKKPNSFGLYDMHGNVYEWCQDWYAKSYQNVSGTDPKGPSSGECRVCRGSSWIISASCCRSARRFNCLPRDTLTFVGFRVALDSN